MDFEVDRTDLHRTRIVAPPDRTLANGEARIRVDGFGLTANNITYAVFGDMMQYWNFFPACANDVGDTTQWGRVPVWGFGDVIESRADGLDIGRRIYGYLPMSTEFVMRPGNITDRGCLDTSAHRSEMAAAYNQYQFVDAQSIYDVKREAHQMLCWPLFLTGFLIDDFLGDNNMFGATVVVISSASSKTASATAFLAHDRPGIEVVGLTSTNNVEFVKQLGCYDLVISYDELDTLPAGDAVFVDIAGNRDVQGAVHRHYGEQLRHSMIVGGTHWAHKTEDATPLAGPEPLFFFAPAQAAKRSGAWGQGEMDTGIAAAWAQYVPWTDLWVDFRHARGVEAVEAVYRELLDGGTDPRVGHICTMHT